MDLARRPVVMLAAKLVGGRPHFVGIEVRHGAFDLAEPLEGSVDLLVAAPPGLIAVHAVQGSGDILLGYEAAGQLRDWTQELAAAGR